MTDWTRLTDFIDANECQWTREPEAISEQWGIHLLDTPPHNTLLGPVFSRGAPAGLICKNGETLCQWGDIHRADMTFSVTKTCLALLTGVAVDRGLIPNIDDPVYQYTDLAGFTDSHNRQITFRHMLQFTSEWSGVCFGIPDQVDHYRTVAMQASPAGTKENAKGNKRTLCKPGTHWEYNDIRINQFSLALMHIFQQPLPEVFKETIAEPIGVSNNWSWHGYKNSFVEINGKQLQSVPGGGHWGGGLVIAPADQALVGQLILQHGLWQGRQVISADWIRAMLTPCPIAPFYGFFTWLNTGNCISKAASAESFFAMGIGGQLIWHDPVNQTVGVFRWLADNSFETVIQLAAEQLGNSTTGNKQ